MNSVILHFALSFFLISNDVDHLPHFAHIISSHIDDLSSELLVLADYPEQNLQHGRIVEFLRYRQIIA